MKSSNSLLWILSILVTFCFGCTSRKIHTSATQLNVSPRTFVGARVALENIRFFISNVPAQAQIGTAYNPGAVVAGSMNGTVVTPSIVVMPGDAQQASLSYNLYAERRLYDALRQMSDGKISSASRSPYEIERIEVIGKYPDQKMGETVAVRSASFFIPPLANVKTKLERSYQVGYVLKKDDSIIQKNVISGIITGDYKGWYVAGVKEGQKLTAELNNAAEREIAVKLLNDIVAAIEKDQSIK